MNLAQRLVRKGVLDAADLERITEAQKNAPNKPLHEILIERGFVKEEDILPALAEDSSEVRPEQERAVGEQGVRDAVAGDSGQPAEKEREDGRRSGPEVGRLQGRLRCPAGFPAPASSTPRSGVPT